jgi:NADH-quinone oxidoreductase subunit A
MPAEVAATRVARGHDERVVQSCERTTIDARTLLGPRIETMNAYAPMFLMFLVGAVLVGVFFALAVLVGPKSDTKPEHNLPFECGSESSGANHTRLSVKFYLTAILFVVFDIEAIFLYPWAIKFRSLGWTGFAEMLAFLAVLVIGLVYVWKKGALDWES